MQVFVYILINMNKILLPTFLVTTIIKIQGITAKSCEIDITSLKPEPLVLHSNTSNFVYPHPDENSVFIDSGHYIDILCPGGQVKLSGKEIPENLVKVSCVENNFFTINGTKTPFSGISCSRNPLHILRKTNQSCGQNGTELEVGFQPNKLQFIRQLQLCFDAKLQNPLYAHFDVVNSAQHEVNVKRPNFLLDDLYHFSGGKTMNSLYKRKTQRATINRLIGFPLASEDYISSNNFLTKGHLAAKGDFFYAPQQLATFHFVNTAPQWYTINRYNWNAVEMSVRDYADKNNVDLQVFSGTFGVCQLRNGTGSLVDVYLYVDESTNTRAVPVPGLFWRVVYSPKVKKPVALLGVNNPFIDEVATVCADVFNSIKWVKWSLRSNFTKGYIYACSVDELRKHVKFVPQIDVQGLLI